MGLEWIESSFPANAYAYIAVFSPRMRAGLPPSTPNDPRESYIHKYQHETLPSRGDVARKGARERDIDNICEFKEQFQSVAEKSVAVASKMSVRERIVVFATLRLD